MNEKDSKRETLQWIREQGLKPVPVNGKAATTANYTKSDWVPPGDEHWDMNPGLGVGALWSSTGIMDVDLDCVESIFFADRLLPPTDFIFGREGKRRSHRL